MLLVLIHPVFTFTLVNVSGFCARVLCVVYLLCCVCVCMQTPSLVSPQELPTPARNRLRAVDILGGKLIVGTIAGEISIIDIASHNMVSVVHSAHHGDWKDKHAYGELWGLTPVPGQKMVFTCGDDATVRCWDIVNRKMKSSEDLFCQAICLSCSPNGMDVAVGFKDGSFSVMATDDMTESIRVRQFRQRVTCIK